ncbi:MAG: hypothetical protein DYH05_08875 [Acidobacteria bacterium ACB1]|nr:hypothetical protein [Acidobacteria bacterium ACB1]RIJ92016.1 MAG: hypothetical protein DCC44_08490 [Acidobacteriota bacterium]
MIGGYAVAFYGHVRATKDLDVFIRSTKTNAEIVFRAIAEFGAPLGSIEVSPEDLVDGDVVIQIGVPPRRIDIVLKASGITFDDAIRESRSLQIEGRSIPVIGLSSLIANKSALGRLQDLADVEALTKIAEKPT